MRRAGLILAASLVLSVGCGDKVKQQQRLSESAVGAVQIGLDLYRQQNGRYPDDLKALVKAKLIAQVPLDPWGRELVYQREEEPAEDGKGTLDGYLLASYGADGREGGDGTDADFVRRGELKPVVVKTEEPPAP